MRRHPPEDPAHHRIAAANPATRTATPALGALLAAAAALVWAQLHRLSHARAASARPVAPFRRECPGAHQRILLLGDSTGVGLGCDAGQHSIAARLAADVPQAEIVNQCRTGARVADVLHTARALPPEERFDLVLVLAGGNDVLRATRTRTLRLQVADLLVRLRLHSPHVVWAGMANVGLAPLFLPPFSWWMSVRTRRVSRLLAECVAGHGGRYVEFFRDAARDPFSADPGRYYAADGVHPSAEAYGWCYRHLQPALAPVLRPRTALPRS